MDNMYAIRGKLQEVYAKYSRIIDKGIQFVLALATFVVINQNIGFMKMAASPIVAIALAVICTFLSMNVILIVAAVLILAHMSAVSIGALVTTLIIFLIMYIFFFRMAPKYAVIVLVTALAFAFKIPYLIPIVCALIVAPVGLIPIMCGTIVYYMLAYVKKASANLESSGIRASMSVAAKYLKQTFQSKEMWIVIFAFVIAFFVVYTLRRASVDHAWKIAIVAGSVVNIVVIAAGSIVLGVHTSYGPLIIGNALAIVIGLGLELFLFSVDYARCENLQYEDDEYYYYVKAVPKVAISNPEKMVKHINERQGTEIIDTEEVRKKAAESRNERREEKNKKFKNEQAIDQQLFEESLKKDLTLKK